VLRVVLRTNKDCVLIQHQLFGFSKRGVCSRDYVHLQQLIHFYKRGGVCLLCCTKEIFKKIIQVILSS
jgi:uncharacterized protein YbgA (DUF1722 family)